MDCILLVPNAGSSWLKFAACEVAERVRGCLACHVRRKIAALAVATGGVYVLGRHTDAERMLAEPPLATIGGEAAGRVPAPA